MKSIASFSILFISIYFIKSALCRHIAIGIYTKLLFLFSLLNYANVSFIFYYADEQFISTIIPWVPSMCCFQNMRCRYPPAKSYVSVVITKKVTFKPYKLASRMLRSFVFCTFRFAYFPYTITYTNAKIFVIYTCLSRLG